MDNSVASIFICEWKNCSCTNLLAKLFWEISFWQICEPEKSWDNKLFDSRFVPAAKFCISQIDLTAFCWSRYAAADHKQREREIVFWSLFSLRSVLSSFCRESSLELIFRSTFEVLGLDVCLWELTQWQCDQSDHCPWWVIARKRGVRASPGFLAKSQWDTWESEAAALLMVPSKIDNG